MFSAPQLWIPTVKPIVAASSVSVSVLGGDAQDMGFSTPMTTAGLTFTAGLCVIATYVDYDTTPASITANGTGLTQIGSTIAAASGGDLSFWKGTVSAGTGSVVLNSASIFGCLAWCGWILSGANSTETDTDSFNTNPQVDPQGPLTSLTIPSGGVGLIAIGVSQAGTNQLPASWNGATRDSATEKAIGTGNTSCIAGAHTTTAGTNNISVSGSGGDGYNYGPAMMGVAFGP